MFGDEDRNGYSEFVGDDLIFFCHAERSLSICTFVYEQMLRLRTA